MSPIKSVTLAGLMLASLSAFSQANQTPIRVVVDGESIYFSDQQPAESNGRVLVPLRGVFEKLGANVDWDPSTQTITAQKNRTRVRLSIGQLDASVDNRPVHMDVPAILVGGTTMVPLRFVSEALGAYVTWNATSHEVDIRKSTDFNLPRERDGDRQRVDTPPTRVIPVQPRRDRPQLSSVPADTVIPFELNTRLSSRVAQRGDQFTTTLMTDGTRHYYDLPAGTKAFGHVNFVRARDRQNPGIIELQFDYMILPNGRKVNLFGNLVGLDDASVRRLPNGAIIARGNERHDHVMFSGSGDGLGLVFGFKEQKGGIEIDLGRLVEGALRNKPPRTDVRDVELRPGTQLGFRLYKDIAIPRLR